MSSIHSTVLGDFSQAITGLVGKVAAGLVAVKISPHRTVSGVALQENLISVADHSLRRQEWVQVQASDGSEAKASILGRDPSVDVAILKAEGLATRPLPKADPATLKIGMIAGVVGLTVDVGPSASLGIVGALGSSRRTWRGGLLDSFIRLDVNLYPSQSGAAVVDSDGQLIGMATAGLLSHSAVAVPVATIDRIAQEILSQGRIRHGYLGVSAQPVAIPTNLQQKLSKEQDSGLILVNVEPDSPAERAGLQLGDILLSLGEARLNDVDDLQTALRRNVVGVTVGLTLLRGGEPSKLDVTIGERSRG
jgi:serine protease Do